MQDDCYGMNGSVDDVHVMLFVCIKGRGFGEIRFTESGNSHLTGTALVMGIVGRLMRMDF